MWTNLRSLPKGTERRSARWGVSKSDFYCWVWCQHQSEKLKKRKENRLDKALWNCYTGLIPGGVGHCSCIKTMQRGGMYQVMRSQYPYRCQVTPLNRSYVQILRTAAISSLLRMSHVTSKISHSWRHFFMYSESEEEYYLKCSEGRVAGHCCPWGTRHVGPFSKRLYWWLLEEASHWINKSKKIALKLFIAWPQSHWYLRFFCEFCLCSSWSCFCCGCLSCSRQWCPEYIPHH